jgi:hypothetical protein
MIGLLNRIKNTNGWIRLWLISLIVVFLYSFSTTSEIYSDSLVFLPNFISRYADIIYFNFYVMGINSHLIFDNFLYANQFFWSLCVTFIFGSFSITFGYGIKWIGSGFKK